MDFIDLLRDVWIWDFKFGQVLVRYVKVWLVRQINCWNLGVTVFTSAVWIEKLIIHFWRLILLCLTESWTSRIRTWVFLLTTCSTQASQDLLVVAKIAIQYAVDGVIFMVWLVKTIWCVWPSVFLIHCLQHILQLDWPRSKMRVVESNIRVGLLGDLYCIFKVFPHFHDVLWLLVFIKVDTFTLVVLFNYF